MTVNTCTADHARALADLSAGRVPRHAPGARDLERADAARAADPGPPAGVSTRGDRARAAVAEPFERDVAGPTPPVMAGSGSAIARPIHPCTNSIFAPGGACVDGRLKACHGRVGGVRPGRWRRSPAAPIHLGRPLARPAARHGRAERHARTVSATAAGISTRSAPSPPAWRWPRPAPTSSMWAARAPGPARRPSHRMRSKPAWCRSSAPGRGGREGLDRHAQRRDHGGRAGRRRRHRQRHLGPDARSGRRRRWSRRAAARLC